jgi:hypothetical protein
MFADEMRAGRVEKVEKVREIGRLGDWEIGRLGDWAIGRLGDWEIRRLEGAAVDRYRGPQDPRNSKWQSAEPFAKAAWGLGSLIEPHADITIVVRKRDLSPRLGIDQFVLQEALQIEMTNRSSLKAEL